MKKLMVISVLSALVGVVSCGKEQRPPPREILPQERKLVVASNQFGFSLFNEVVSQSEGGNVFISPLSVSMALGMVYNGARGDTEAGMRATLAYGDLSPEEINQSYLSLIEFLTHLDPKVTMEIANSIWIREGLSVLEAFIELNRKFFLAEVTSLDFSAPDAADTINGWVSEKTHGKITEIVASPIDPMLVMFLINAVYFKGSWTIQFDPAKTVDTTFHAPAGDLTVRQMTVHDTFPYLETADFQAVDLPYGDGAFAATILLPAAGKTADELIAALSSESWAALVAGLVPSEGDVALPRFELDYKVSLAAVLQALGMGIAFGEGADFSGINGPGGLFISDVLHKSYLKVNEEGTEAAAVTSVEVGGECSACGSPFFWLNVDRPFVLVIHERQSGALLFMGKIVAPDSE
jgi:serine protease inhibitor